MTLSVDAFDDTFALRAACECAAAEVDSNRIHLLSARHAKNYAEQQVLEASRVVDERIRNRGSNRTQSACAPMHETEQFWALHTTLVGFAERLAIAWLYVPGLTHQRSPPNWAKLVCLP